MRLSKTIRVTARRARAAIMPIKDPKPHLCNLIRHSGKDLGFDRMVIDSLVDGANLTIRESWLEK